MLTHPQDFIEKQIITTRYFKDADEMLVSMAGIAFLRDEKGGRTGCILSPNDPNISLAVSGHADEQSQLIVYHCFAGLFASRIYRCLTKPYEFFRLHMNVYQKDTQPEHDYGELILTQDRGGQTARVYLEHFGQQIFSSHVIVDLIHREALEEMIEACPVKLAPSFQLYSINMNLIPHPGLVPAADGRFAGYVMGAKPMPKELIQ